jgi:hypothetical protein
VILRSRTLGTHLRGQTLVETALVLPLLLAFLFGIISLGMGIFFQQQVTNAAREAARYAAVHSATAECGTVGNLNPDSMDPPGVSGHHATYQPLHYNRCDRIEFGWPKMTAWARERLFGLPPQAVRVVACWSGYRMDSNDAFDAPPDELEVEVTPGVTTTYQTHWAQCTMAGQDPTTNPDAIPCTGSIVTDDEASNMSEGPGVIVGNRVTAYACYSWTPPLAGFLLIPPQMELRAVITEPIQRQQ